MELRFFLKIVVILALTAVFLLTVYSLGSILAPFVISYILFFVLKPFVKKLEQSGVNHALAVSAVFFSAFILFALFLSIFLPAFYGEVVTIQDKIDVYVDVFNEKTTALKHSLSTGSGGFSFLFNDGNISMMEENIKGALTSLVGNLPSMLFGLLPFVLYFLVIPFATFFFLLDEVNIKKYLVSFVPNRHFEAAMQLIHSLNQQFGWLLRGMTTSAVIISILASTGLWLIGLDYPILVGIFSGIANLIPYVGPIAGALAACLVAVLTMKPAIWFLYIVLVFIAVNIIDNIFVQPLVLARAANLHPVVVIFLVLSGSRFGGILGMLLAVPLASFLKVISTNLYREFTRKKHIPFSQYRLVECNGPVCPVSDTDPVT